VHTATGYTHYTNFSGWDIYRGQMQLLALLAPQKASEMIRSLVEDGEETGQLPRWPVANAETGLMVGDPSDAIIADAYAFGARDFDAELALHEMLHGASTPQPIQAQAQASKSTGYLERPALAAYLRRGYIPGAGSTTLEYALADFAISQLASALGDQADADALLNRSANWKQLLNPQTRFIEPRLGNGSFPATYSPTSTTGFVEGDGWQYTWMVPQDMADLLSAIGPKPARQRLDSFFARLNAGPTAPHAWLGNEPSFLSPFAYLWLGLPWRAEAVIHTALATLFTAKPNGLPGNDDLGALSSWYVWNALGLYPVIPAVAGLAIGSPLFPHATITLANTTILKITTHTNTSDHYIRSLTIDGQPYETSWLPLATIASGGTLAFTLGPKPAAWATTATSTPPSFTPNDASQTKREPLGLPGFRGDFAACEGWSRPKPGPCRR
jgi:predicted alpha-1,2-mannosidase